MKLSFIFLTKCTKLTFDLTATLKRKFTLGIRPYVVCSNIKNNSSLCDKNTIMRYCRNQARSTTKCFIISMILIVYLHKLCSFHKNMHFAYLL